MTASPEDLRAKGYKVPDADIENYWVKGDAYNGVNASVVTPLGDTIELQFHTPESFALKEEVHELYDDMRDPKVAMLRRRALFDYMRLRTDAMEQPRNIFDLGTPTEAIPGVS